MSSVPQAEPAASADDGIPVLTEVVPAGVLAGVLANTQRRAALDSAASIAHLGKTQNLQALCALLAAPTTSVAPAPPPLDTAIPPVSSGSVAAASMPEAPAPASASGAAYSDVEIEALSLRVHSRVLAGLMTRIDPVVDQRLRESLTDLLEQVLAGMTAELKVTARRIVRDAVAQAVAAELAQLPRNGPPHV